MSGGRTRFSRLPWYQKITLVVGYVFLCFFGLVATLAKRLARAFRHFFTYYTPALTRAFLERKKKETFEDFSESRLLYDDGDLAPKDMLGLAGELAVFDLIRSQARRRVIACNMANYYCEIDLIYEDKATREIVFVEVKTRRKENLVYRTEEAVDAKRRKKMALAARLFAEERGYRRYKKRFDIAVVLWELGAAKPEITIDEGAFTEYDAILGYKADDFGKVRNRT